MWKNVNTIIPQTWSRKMSRKFCRKLLDNLRKFIWFENEKQSQNFQID